MHLGRQKSDWLTGHWPAPLRRIRGCMLVLVPHHLNPFLVEKRNIYSREFVLLLLLMIFFFLTKNTPFPGLSRENLPRTNSQKYTPFLEKKGEKRGGTYMALFAFEWGRSIDQNNVRVAGLLLYSPLWTRLQHVRTVSRTQQRHDTLLTHSILAIESIQRRIVHSKVRSIYIDCRMFGIKFMMSIIKVDLFTD